MVFKMLQNSYLPHRQLRNQYVDNYAPMMCYLPHRQLRKLTQCTQGPPFRYLPHRQLRN